ncbi:MAG: nitrate reductase molybdenum cofactor assembly chaperone [Candidatus Nanopelagicales bacterium]|jgi:nitrate reductase delta subunit|nr:nitrate reductase molybdenum cofactor assembly chaperone [Actinomycetes bacterium]MCU0301199.1 nitrate reductase molybdenum cofactor assembly chaperone [Candidatus Nanopelagicales bacterium]
MSPLGRTATREAAEFLGIPLRLRRPRSPVESLRAHGLSEREVAATRLATSWLLAYPDEALLDRLDVLAAAVLELPAPASTPLSAFLAHLDGTPMGNVQRHYVEVFDMKRRACPFLTYWTHGDTRNRGVAILRFKQAYEEAGFSIGSEELPDHLAVVLEFAAVGERVTGDALLAEHAAPIALLREALHDLGSAYAHVLDAVVATLPEVTPELQARMAQLAAAGPPAEQVGLEPFPTAPTPTGARR